MSAVGSQPLPSFLPTLVVALENYAAPAEVQKILGAVTIALHAEKPRVTLNRRFAKLRQANPDIYRKAALWFKQPEVKARISSNGAYWALQIWRRALQMLHRGKPAHVAFGMNVGGRPQHGGFSHAVEAAVYAVEAYKNGQAPDIYSATTNAALIYKARLEDVLKQLQLAHTLSSEDRQEMINHAAAKRK